MKQSRTLRLALGVARIAAVLLPAAARNRYREQWQADVRGAADLGLSPLRLAAGTITAAIQLAGTSGKGTLMLAAGNAGLVLRSLGGLWVRNRLAILQLGLAALYGSVLLLYVASRVRLGISHHELTHGGYDPKDQVPFGSHWFNPLTWLFVLGELYVMLHGWVIGLALAMGTVVQALRRDGHRRRLAAAASVVSLLVLAVALTSFGSDIRTWMLD